MKTIKLIALFTLAFCSLSFAQTKLPVKFRVEKEAMSTPMSPVADMFFLNYFDIKPVNIKFDGSVLNMYYDNGASYVKMNVTQVSRNMEYENNNPTIETILYTNNNNVSDTISFITDFNVGYVQVVVPTKNSKGEYIGYTSFQKFIPVETLAITE